MSSSIYTQLVSNLIFPLHERMKRHDTFAIRKSLERSQWWSRDHIERLQYEKLNRFLNRVYKGVPYYRKILDRVGMSGGKINSLKDLERLPYLTKPIVRANNEDMKSMEAKGLLKFNTGGSTGEPLVFWLGRERVSHDVAAKWRATRWYGVDIGDPEIVVWGSPIELAAQDHIRNLRDLVLRTHLLSAFDMSEKKVNQYIGKIRFVRPRMIFGYPSSINIIAAYAEREGARLDDLGVKVVFVTSEILYEDQRERIERVFGCPVANGYGGRDSGFVAHQCPDGGMHIVAEDIIVEIIDVKGNVLPSGQQGEVVITHLASGDFPFIRYRTGDVAIRSDRTCACGRGLPLLEEIKGRSTDFVQAVDGTLMHGLALIYVIRDIPCIENFKITQESLQSTRVELVTTVGFASEDIARIDRGIRERLGQEVNVTIDQVAHIDRESSGKYRYVVSKVTGGEH